MVNGGFINRVYSGFLQSHYLLIRGSLNTLPLINPEKKLCLFINAKAGCTFATTWFFFQQGILDEALKYHYWVHNYRYDIYYRRKEYNVSLKSIFNDDYVRIKLVRSPFQRAVSSYIHAIKTKYAIEEISTFLRREVSDDRKFTFEEFVAYLEKTGVIRSNMHHRVQLEPLEKKGILKISKVIKLEEATSSFGRLEKELGLKQSDQESMMESFNKLSHHRKKVVNDEYCGNREFKQTDTEFSHYQAFYNEDLKNRIAVLYACDFEQYGYPVDVI